jgi:DNA-binding transcriptional regulator YiaG
MPPKNNSCRRKFAVALRAWRQRNGALTMRDAAKHLAVPYRTWQDWEAGRHEPRGLSRRLILNRLQT